MTRPGIYARVSDPRQTDNHSIPAQVKACREFCAARGLSDPLLFLEEGVSAFSDDPESRPAFSRLLVAAEAGEIGVVVTLDMDRFSRSTLAALLAMGRLEVARVPLLFVNDPSDDPSPERKTMLTIKASFAELESRKKAARVRLSQALMRSEGKWLNRPPFGAMIGPDGRLCIDPERAGLLARILTEAAREPDNVIAERLTAEGVPTPGSDRKATRWGGSYGGAWWPSTIRAIIRNGGWLATQREPWPALWLAAAERPRRPKVTGGRATRFLSGLMRCPCGGVITYGGKRGPRDRLTVQCHGIRARGVRARCPHRKTYADVYEADVLAQILSLGDPGHKRRVVARDDARAQLADLEAEYERLADVYRAGIYSKARFQAELFALDKRKAAIPADNDYWVALCDDLPDLQGALPGLPPHEQNAVARLFIERVTIDGSRAIVAWRREFADAYGPDLH